jgi:hypothetical protein
MATHRDIYPTVRSVSCGSGERGQNRSSILFPPATLNFGEESCTIPRQALDERAGSSRPVVSRSPEPELQKDRSQSDSFVRQSIVHPPPVSLISLDAYNSICFQPFQPVRQNVGSNPLACVMKFLEGLQATHHQIANDYERPAVADDF